MAYQSFEDLEVWQKAYKLSVKIYRVLEHSREYGLKDQMTRAGVSIASNIAEGAERGSVAEFNRFLHIAKGSTAELRTQLLIAFDIGIISESKKKRVDNGGREYLQDAACIDKIHETKSIARKHFVSNFPKTIRYVLIQNSIKISRVQC